MTPASHTAAPVLAVFVGRLLKWMPHKRFILDARLALAARASVGRN